MSEQQLSEQSDSRNQERRVQAAAASLRKWFTSPGYGHEEAARLALEAADNAHADDGDKGFSS